MTLVPLSEVNDQVFHVLQHHSTSGLWGGIEKEEGVEFPFEQ